LAEIRAEPVAPPEIVVPEPRGDVVVLPRETTEEGHGLYDDSVITLVKEFRALGVDASYQHDQDHRNWIGEKAVPLFAIDLIIGIASNAGWSALCKLLRRDHKGEQVRVRVGRFKRTGSGEFSCEWYEVEGPGRWCRQGTRRSRGATRIGRGRPWPRRTQGAPRIVKPL
jgi:hypothetical protein